MTMTSTNRGSKARGAALAAVVPLLLVAACSSGSGSAEGEDGEIRMMVNLTDNLNQAYWEKLVKPFEDVAFALAVDTVSDILETPFGYHIIIKTGEEKGRTPTLEELHDKIATFLFHAQRGQVVADHVADLRAKADITLA